jgi:hypothetical protein
MVMGRKAEKAGRFAGRPLNRFATAGAVGGDDGRRLDQTGEARRLGETTGLSPITVTHQALVSAATVATAFTLEE